ncbi:hypothetical protein D3C72_1201890 [compost metagenome]
MRACAVLGQGLLVVGNVQCQFDANLGQIGLHGLRDLVVRIGVAHLHGHGKTIGQARLGKQRLGLGHVLLVGVVLPGAQHVRGQKGLVYVVERLDDVLLDAVVVHRVAHGFTHLGLGQIGVLLVHAHVVHHGLRHGLQLDLAGFLQRHHVVGAQLAGNVHIALFQQQAAARCLWHMAQHHALHCSRRPVAVKAVQGQGLVGRPFVQLEDARARLVGLEPAIAHVIALRLFGEQLFVDDGCRPAAQNGQHEGRCELAVGGDGHGIRIHQLDVLQCVVLGQPDTGQHHRRAFAQKRCALQRPGHVFGGNRVARVELLALADLEREGLAIFAHAPRFGHVTIEFTGLGQIGADQPVVGVGQVLHRHQFIDFGRIEGGEFVKRARHHQHVLGSGRLREGQPAHSGGSARHGRSSGQYLSTNHCLHGRLLSWVSEKRKCRKGQKPGNLKSTQRANPTADCSSHELGHASGAIFDQRVLHGAR